MKTFYLIVGLMSLISVASASKIVSSDSPFLTATNDAILTAQVKSAFFFHPTTKSPRIHVETSHSKVFLSGELDTLEEIKIAKFISETIPGVYSVNVQQLTAKNTNYHQKIAKTQSFYTLASSKL